jgi:modification methylase
MNTDLKNKIINGDSLEELKKIPSESFDLIFADPLTTYN